MIQLKGISRFFSSGFVKTYVLRNIDLDLQQGEFLTIMVPSDSSRQA